MSRRLFRFQQFSMCDEHCGMRIGTDAVLLGAWTQISVATHRVADIGCGCGIIALMLAQRSPEAFIDAVEIDSGACADAKNNFDASPWSDRLRLHECAFDSMSDSGPYDLIASNPPYFTESLHSPSPARAGARHAGTLCFASLAEACTRMLAAEGRLAVVLPAAQDEDTLHIAAAYGLGPTRHCTVRNSPDASPVRSLWEFAFGSHAACEEETLTIRYSSGRFSSQYLNLTSEFHLQSVIENNR